MRPASTPLDRLDHLAFWRPALRVLCYHRVAPFSDDPLTITTRQFSEQISSLVAAGFRFIRVSDLVKGSPLPERAVLVTFDDGYADTLDHAAPILADHDAPAAVFVVTSCVGDRARWDPDGADLMSVEQLRQLHDQGFELCHHSDAHRSFAALTLGEIEADLRRSLAFFEVHALPVCPALAYPYGARPKAPKAAFGGLLQSLGLHLGFRLGGRLNRLPLARNFEIQRLVVTPDLDLSAFANRVSLGRIL